MGEYFGGILGDAVGVKAGERWKIMRKYFDPEFAFQPSRQAIPKFAASISRWVGTLPAEAKSPQPGSFIVDVKKPCRFLPFQLVAQHLYGDVFSDELYSTLLEINTLHEVVLHDVIINKRVTTKLGNWMDTAARKRMREYNQKWESFNVDIINHARKNNLACPLERIYQGVDQAKEMTKTEFLHTLDEILFANVDVSSAVLNTIFTKLAADPAFQSALRAEIAAQKAQEQYNVVKYLAKQDSLLNFLMMESMRLSPAFWFSLPECTAVPKTIGGYHVPANTPVVIDVRRLNTDPVTWGADGHAFRPERFREMPPSKCRYGFMRFGAGGASGRCLGKNIADVVFKLATLAVVERYALSTPGGCDGSSEVEFTPVRPVLGLVGFVCSSLV
ncbi:hypothetical protein VTN77DRAFT_9276 [Rasamsonia byssochlamydoides]|uniref:uncharacterized protein n=1 Tax=Rasamsonia byssochlamydoides TaxID=89139 RepID=UPI0037429299